MKKRKKPILMGAVLVLLAAFVVALNASNFAAASPDPQPTPDAQPAAPKSDKPNPRQAVLDKEKADAAKEPGPGVMQPKADDDLPIHAKGHDAIRPDDPKIMAPE